MISTFPFYASNGPDKGPLRFVINDVGGGNVVLLLVSFELIGCISRRVRGLILSRLPGLLECLTTLLCIFNNVEELNAIKILAIKTVKHNILRN